MENDQNDEALSESDKKIYAKKLLHDGRKSDKDVGGNETFSNQTLIMKIVIEEKV